MFFPTRVPANVARDSKTAPHKTDLNLCSVLITASSRLPAACHHRLSPRGTFGGGKPETESFHLSASPPGPHGFVSPAAQSRGRKSSKIDEPVYPNHPAVHNLAQIRPHTALPARPFFSKSLHHHSKPPNLAQLCTILPIGFVFPSRRPTTVTTPPDPTTSFLIGVHRRCRPEGFFPHFLTPNAPPRTIVHNPAQPTPPSRHLLPPPPDPFLQKIAPPVTSPQVRRRFALTAAPFRERKSSKNRRTCHRTGSDQDGLPTKKTVPQRRRQMANLPSRLSPGQDSLKSVFTRFRNWGRLKG
jgi:hypothetical protein